MLELEISFSCSYKYFIGGIFECLPTGESQCPEVVGTGIGDSAAQDGQMKDQEKVRR